MKEQSSVDVLRNRFIIVIRLFIETLNRFFKENEDLFPHKISEKDIFAAVVNTVMRLFIILWVEDYNMLCFEDIFYKSDDFVFYLLTKIQKYLKEDHTICWYCRNWGINELKRVILTSFDIEKVGSIYEGILDYTAKRSDEILLIIKGRKECYLEVPLTYLEQSHISNTLLSYLEKITSRSSASIQENLAASLDKPSERSRLMEACDNEYEIFNRILPFAGLLQKDTFGNVVIVTQGSIYITTGEDRRATGTHYTPIDLTEPLVRHALDPLVYTGPAEGQPEQEWQLHTPREILDLKICDMAMGGGAFLVQACRYLSEKLVVAWENAYHILNQQNGNNPKPLVIPEGTLSQGRFDEELLPDDPEERNLVACRFISERCLYGVDKNPMAVEIAKLSLWLVTMAREKPFTFLDHNLRCGDSLLGVHEERQLQNGSLDAKAGEITQDVLYLRPTMQNVLATAIKKRRQIAMRSDIDITVTLEKARLLKEADQSLEIIKLGADLLVGIALSDPKHRPGIEKAFKTRYVVLAKAFDEAFHQRQTDFGWAAKNEEFTKLRTEVDKLLGGRNPFHWPLEFPEVFIGKGNDAGFDAMIGNPPFQGGQKITGILGTDYRDYLVTHLARGKRGSADLCAYFFLRATESKRENSMCALLATNTIAQGDTREVGLDQIASSGWVIPRAIPSRKWPGDANVEVAYIWLRRGPWDGGYMLDDKPTAGITPFLTKPGAVQGNPYKLVSNTNKSFQGSNVLGMGFVLTPDEAKVLIAKDTRSKDVLFPYLNGEDLNTRPDQSPSRWVINFHNWSLERAEEYPDCIKIVREKVKPERDLNSVKSRRELWWQFTRPVLALYSAITDMKRVLVRTQVSKYHSFVFVPQNMVFDQRLVVFASSSYRHFAQMQTSLHTEWAQAFGSTFGLAPIYTPSDCFETFPFPPNTDNLEDIGECYHLHRQAIMLARQEGLTKTYNRFHDAQEHFADIVKLREIHKEIDEAVAHAYGWDDLRLDHGFHETKQGVRYTISEAARCEVLDRLLLLNHQRHEEEVMSGSLEPKKKKAVPR